MMMIVMMIIQVSAPGVTDNLVILKEPLHEASGLNQIHLPIQIHENYLL